MLAPRELDFIADEIQGFDFTRGIYELYGAGKQMRRVSTVPQALNLPPE